MNTIAENKQVTFQYDPDKKLLLSTYKGIFNFEIAKDSYNYLANLYIVGKIADVRKLNGSFIKLMSEFKEKYPILKERGLKAEAFVVSDDLMINNLISKLSKQLEGIGIDTYVCHTVEEAENWLDNYIV